MDQDTEQAHAIPANLVRIDAPDTLHGWALVERGSPAHIAAEARAAADAQAVADALALKEAVEADEAAKAAATARRRS